MKAASQVTDHLTIEDTVIEEDLSDTYHTTIHTCFNLGFEVRLKILYNTVLYLIEHVKKKIIWILKNPSRFSGKGRQLLHNYYINIMRIRQRLISYIKLDRTFH